MHQLRELIYNAPEFAMRTACMVLVQVYAAFFQGGSNMVGRCSEGRRHGSSVSLGRRAEADDSIPER